MRRARAPGIIAVDDEFTSDPSNQRGMTESGKARARGDMRDSMFFHASMRLPPEDASIPLRVRNLSAGGLMADCTAMVEQGREVEVGLRNLGVVPGRIAWVRDDQIGITFLNRIDPRLARKPVGMHGGKTTLLRPAVSVERRPGLKTK